MSELLWLWQSEKLQLYNMKDNHVVTGIVHQEKLQLYNMKDNHVVTGIVHHNYFLPRPFQFTSHSPSAVLTQNCNLTCILIWI